MSESLRVIVVGGGIGGLCLAHGLRRAGVSVQVYERDRSPGARPEGYRIHVNPAGARSLRACLPDDLWQAFLATSGPGGDFGFLTEGLEELLVVEEAIMYPGGVSDPGENHYAVDRRTLRRLLLTGLDDVVAFDAEFVRYEHSADGRVVAVFADGRTAAGDLLIGADGASSRVCRQYLPHAKPVDVGVGGFGHKLYLTEDTRRWVPERLQLGMNSIMANAPMFLFTSVYDPPAHAAAALQAVTGDAPEGIDAPYVLCALVADQSVLPDAVATLDDEGLRHAVDQMVSSWHPTLRRVLAESDPAARGGLEFTASPEIAPWTPTRITVLGDAIHTMPPVGGLGANTALRDARLLCQQLSLVACGDRGLLDAVGTYETEMRDYGYAAVRAALALEDRSLATGALASLLARSWFRLCQALPALRRRTFGGWDTAAAPRSWEHTPTPGQAEPAQPG